MNIMISKQYIVYLDRERLFVPAPPARATRPSFFLPFSLDSPLNSRTRLAARSSADRLI